MKPGCTDSVSLGVYLPLDCPVTFYTDLVRVTTTCKIVLMVKKNVRSGEDATTTRGGSKYDFLTLEVPYAVLQGAFGSDNGEEESDMMHLNESGDSDAHYLGYGWVKKQDGNAGKESKNDVTSWRGDFVADDIMNDLKMISMYLGTWLVRKKGSCDNNYALL